MIARPSQCPNWFTQTAESLFDRFLTPHLTGRETWAVQLGVFAGDATVWLLDRFPELHLVDVDTWEGSEEHDGIDFARIEECYLDRTAIYRPGRLTTLKMTTDQFLFSPRAILGQPIDFVYVDADHRALSVLTDGIGAYQALSVGGLLAFDDYLWSPPTDPEDSPMRGIEAFGHAVNDRMEVLDLTSQAWFRKLR